MTITFGTLSRGLQAQSQLCRSAADYPAETCAKQLWKWLTAWIKTYAFKNMLPVLLENLNTIRRDRPRSLEGSMTMKCHFSADQYLRLVQTNANGRYRLELSLHNTGNDRCAETESITVPSAGKSPLEHLFLKLCAEYRQNYPRSQEDAFLDEVRYKDYVYTSGPRPIESRYMERITRSALQKQSDSTA